MSRTTPKLNKQRAKKEDTHPELYNEANSLTPLCDFVNGYVKSEPLRLHMPGHKGLATSGLPLQGIAAWDLTEIEGADVLYAATGVLKKSQENARKLFGSAKTLYSTEGSSLCIRAMVHLALCRAKRLGEPPLILAARNAHKTFVTAAAVMNVPLSWIYPEEAEGLVCCKVTPDQLQSALSSLPQKPTAVYITSPDYLGNVADIKGLAAVCHKCGVPLFVDNAHGAYLRFLPQDCHPLTLGADLVCDSAHKTLPVLTGGAYLHLSAAAAAEFGKDAETALATFATTSPHYLVLQSLDGANAYLSCGYAQKLAAFLPKARALKAALSHLFPLAGEELKLTLRPKAYGYTGTEVAKRLQNEGIVCEFFDPDYCVMMLTPELSDGDLARLQAALCALPKKEAITAAPPALCPATQVLSANEALFSPSEEVPVCKAIGKVLASPTVFCPPAVPVVCCGERVSERATAAFAYYGIDTCRVVK